MSGIAAIFDTTGAPVPRSAINAMLDAMAYRAVDGQEALNLGETALGFAAMYTSAENRTNPQPLACPFSRFYIIFDGFLLNQQELRDALAQRGAALPGKSDAEIVLHGFAEFGEDILARLEGEFAFVIWDAQKRRLLCARDHHGLRPLTWHCDGRRLLVASDIAGILAATKITPDVNVGYLTEHLANRWYTQDETPWKGVHKLRPAHALSINRTNAQPAIYEYWQLPTDVTIRYKDDAQYAEHYLAMLSDVVEHSCHSDAPLAAEVSGGLDSSSVFALAARAGQQGTWRAPAIHGFALKGHSGDWSDEIAFAQSVAAYSEKTLHELPLFEPSLEWFIRQSQSDKMLPIAPNTVMLASLHKAMAQKGCRICLNGQGGDTWLNGTTAQINQALRLKDWSGAARSIRADRRDFGLRRSGIRALRQGLALLAPKPAKAMVKRLTQETPQLIDTLFWLSSEAKRELDRREERFWSELAVAPKPERHKWERIKEPFATLAIEHLNLLAAKSGIEYRSPMLSRRFIEFSAATPEHVKRRGALPKWLHREAMRGILPDNVRARRDKALFDATFQRLQNDAQSYCSKAPWPLAMASQLQPGGIDALFTQFGNAQIDDGAVWELWGAFASAAFLRDVTE